MERSGLFSRSFWINTADRVMVATAGSLLIMLGGDGIGILDVNWGDKLSIVAMFALTTLLACIAGSRVGNPNSPNILGNSNEQNKAVEDRN